MKKSETVVMKPLAVQEINLTILGDSPLIVHRWDEKAKRAMLDKQMKKATTKEAKDPKAQYESSLYRVGEEFGFPADALKSAAVRGGKSMGVVMTDARGAFFIHGKYSVADGRDLLIINGKPESREDMVRLESGVADIRFRAQFVEWSSIIRVSFNTSVLSAEQIINMINIAGYAVGIGEWRPERNGSFGRFHVEVKG